MTDAALLSDPPDDEFAWWRAALAHPDWIGTPKLPIREAEPQCGFYRVLLNRRGERRGEWQRVAIYLHRGQVIGERDGRIVEDVPSLWIWSCRRPITWELFDAVAKGEPWPDDPPDAPGIGDNIDVADPHDALMIEFLGEQELADEFLSKPVETKDDADRVANWAKKIIDIGKRANAFHTAEKAPSLAEGRRIDERWELLRTRPASLVARLKAHAKAWLDEQDRLERIRVEAARREADRKREEARRAAAEAERRQREADEEARRIAERASRETDERARQEAQRQIEARQREIDEQTAAAGKLVSEAQSAEREAVYRKPQAGKTGSKISERIVSIGKITDYETFLIAAKDQADIRSAAETVCARLARNGITLAGMEIIKEKRVQ